MEKERTRIGAVCGSARHCDIFTRTTTGSTAMVAWLQIRATVVTKALLASKLVNLK